MRGMAAIAVLISHGETFFGALNFPEGFLAVDFFFVLSGFVIAEAYLGRLERNLTWAGFMRVRLIRFYPLYLLGTLLGLIPCVASFFFGNPLHLMLSRVFAILLLGLFMLPSPFALESAPQIVIWFYPLLLVAWSLFWELLANALYGVFFHRLGQRLLLILMVLGALSLAVIQWRGISLGNGGFWSWGNECAAAFRVCFSFCAGLLLQKAPRSSKRLPSLLLLIALILFLGWEPSDAVRPVYELFFIFILSPTLVYLGASTEPRQGVESSVYAFLGAVSYAVYVVHYPMEILIHMLFKHVNIPVESYAPWSGFIFIAGLLILCAYLDIYFDAPVRRWLSRFLGDEVNQA